MSGIVARNVAGQTNEREEFSPVVEIETKQSPAAIRERYFHTPTAHREWFGKRAFDIVGSIALILAFSPIILVITIWLYATKGPILFGHERIGRGGKMFKCYKFRTMVQDADQVLEDLFEREPGLKIEWILNHKLKNDPRITQIGKFLRKTSLDELPQLWNVLRGEMSLVGPRPIVKDEVFRYGRAIRHYLAVKPGLTGLWQISGRNDTGYRRRVALDRLYAMHSCLFLDTRILFRTTMTVLGMKGAY